MPRRQRTADRITLLSGKIQYPGPPAFSCVLSPEGVWRRILENHYQNSRLSPYRLPFASRFDEVEGSEITRRIIQPPEKRRKIIDERETGLSVSLEASASTRLKPYSPNQAFQNKLCCFRSYLLSLRVVHCGPPILFGFHAIGGWSRHGPVSRPRTLPGTARRCRSDRESAPE